MVFHEQKLLFHWNNRLKDRYNCSNQYSITSIPFKINKYPLQKVTDICFLSSISKNLQRPIKQRG